MKGDEILRYLEYSYDNWIQTYTPGGHVLKIEEGGGPAYIPDWMAFREQVL